MEEHKKKWSKGSSMDKQEIGLRFKEFRNGINKSQGELARELNTYQSTITNYELGKTFPRILFLKYFRERYALNINWLITGNNDMFIPREKKTTEKKPGKYKSILYTKFEPNDPRIFLYQELIDLMRKPEIEQIIFAKIMELKLIAKDEIEEFRKKNKDEK